MQDLRTRITADPTGLMSAAQTSERAVEELRARLKALERETKTLTAENVRLHGSSSNLARQLSEQRERAAGLEGRLSVLNSTGGMLRAGMGQLGGAVMAAGAAGLSFQAVLSTLNGIMESTQGTSDALANAMATVKGSIDHVFQSIAMGDWSNLISGLGEAASAANELSKAMDNLGDSQYAEKGYSARIAAAQAAYKEAVANPNSTDEERAKRKGEAERLIREHESALAANVRNTEAAIVANYRKNVSGNATHADDGMGGTIRLPELTAERARRLAEMYMTRDVFGGDPALTAFSKRLKKTEIRIERAQERLDDVPYIYAKQRTQAHEELKRAREERARLIRENGELYQRMVAVDAYSDAERDELQKLVIEGANATRQAYDYRTQKHKVDKRNGKRDDADDDADDSPGGKRKKKKEVPPPPRYSLAYYEEEVKRVRDQLVRATDLGTIATLTRKIEELEGVIRGLNKAAADEVGIQKMMEATEGMQPAELPRYIVPLLGDKGREELKRIDNEIKGLDLLLGVQVRTQADEGALNRTRERINELQGERTLTEGHIRPIGALKWLQDAREDKDKSRPRIVPQASALEEWTNAVSLAHKQHETLISGLEGVGSAFDAMGRAVGGNAAEMLTWAANVANAIATVIPQITALITTRRAESTANASSAATGAAASVSMFGPLAVIGSIATVLSALASIPKFATGGVVGGNSYYGDKILARVNSGELILNAQQQRALHDSLAVGRTDALANAVSVVVNVREVVRGQDIHRIVDRSVRSTSRR